MTNSTDLLVVLTYSKKCFLFLQIRVISLKDRSILSIASILLKTIEQSPQPQLMYMLKMHHLAFYLSKS